MQRILTTAVAAVCVGGLVAAGATPAFAATSAPASAVHITASTAESRSGTAGSTAAGDALAALKTRGDAMIAHRLTALDAATTRANAVKDLTDADRAQILATIGSTRDGLTALKASLDAETEVSAAKKDDVAIVQDYRVYVVVLAQSRLALGADRLTASALPRLQQAHDRLEAKGADTDGLASMQADIDAASAGLDGLAADALAVSPDDYNADHDVMTPLRERLRDALANAKKAVAEGRTLGRGVAATSSPTPAPTSTSHS